MPELGSENIVRAIDEDLISRVESLGSNPGLAILSDNPEHAPSQTYVGIKKKVAKRLGIHAVSIFTSRAEELIEEIESLNQDENTHGMIVQLPLRKPESTDEVVSNIIPEKDVDGLGSDVYYSPATPLGIVNYMEGHDIDYKGSSTTVLGKGRLVGAPLIWLMEQNGAQDMQAFDKYSPKDQVRKRLNSSEIIISATGRPGLLVPEMFDNITSEQVFIDAGAAESGGVVVGDISENLREEALKQDCKITPIKGGIGPLTVRALLSNVVSAAEQRSKAKSIYLSHGK